MSVAPAVANRLYCLRYRAPGLHIPRETCCLAGPVPRSLIALPPVLRCVGSLARESARKCVPCVSGARSDALSILYQSVLCLIYCKLTTDERCCTFRFEAGSIKRVTRHFPSALFCLFVYKCSGKTVHIKLEMLLFAVQPIGKGRSSKKSCGSANRISLGA